MLFLREESEVRCVRSARIGRLGSCSVGAPRETAFPDLIGTETTQISLAGQLDESHLMLLS
jgi:hypothetical protein